MEEQAAAKADEIDAFPLGYWGIWANGHQGPLTISAVDQQGNIEGEVFGNRISGFWDGTAKKITFMRRSHPADDSAMQIYTGYLFLMSDRRPALSGFFEAFRGAGGTASRVVYGWAAMK